MSWSSYGEFRSNLDSQWAAGSKSVPLPDEVPTGYNRDFWFHRWLVGTGCYLPDTAFGGDILFELVDRKYAFLGGLGVRSDDGECAFRVVSWDRAGEPAILPISVEAGRLGTIEADAKLDTIGQGIPVCPRQRAGNDPRQHFSRDPHCPGSRRRLEGQPMMAPYETTAGNAATRAGKRPNPATMPAVPTIPARDIHGSAGQVGELRAPREAGGICSKQGCPRPASGGEAEKKAVKKWRART